LRWQWTINEGVAFQLIVILKASTGLLQMIAFYKLLNRPFHFRILLLSHNHSLKFQLLFQFFIWAQMCFLSSKDNEPKMKELF
jgi:hypothetical protein